QDRHRPARRHAERLPDAERRPRLDAGRVQGLRTAGRAVPSLRDADREDARRRAWHFLLSGLPAMTRALPEGVRVGHWTDRDAWTGCTVCLLPEGSVASCEVRGGAAGTAGSDILQPSSAGPGANAILLTGGSAFGLAAVDGVVRWLDERGIGFETPAARVPLVGAAVVYDLGLGASSIRPDVKAGYAACEAAADHFECGR